jgi:hypothetical protein
MDRVARPPPPRLRRRWPLAAIAVTLALPAAFAAWFFFLAPEDPAPYLATIDALPVPSAWEVVHTQTRRDWYTGSRAIRYYFVDAEPEDIAPVVKDVLRSAGLEIDDQVGSLMFPTCSESGPGGPVSCSVQAFRCGSMESLLEASKLERLYVIVERLYVSVSPRGDFFDVGVNDQRHRVKAANRALVRISADRATAGCLWSSPTTRGSEMPK